MSIDVIDAPLGQASLKYRFGSTFCRSNYQKKFIHLLSMQSWKTPLKMAFVSTHITYKR